VKPLGNFVDHGATEARKPRGVKLGFVKCRRLGLCLDALREVDSILSR
jgi:hypothetical protein